jgi:MGT family glycosyltransferase
MKKQMRFLFCSLDSPGFLYPMIGIANSLQARGHKVAFVSDVDTSDLLANSGLTRIPRGDHDGHSFNVKTWYQPNWIAIQVKHIETALQQFQADAIVGQSLTYGPMIVKELRGFPLALFGFCTFLWPTEASEANRNGSPERERRLRWRFRGMLQTLDQARALFHLPLKDRTMSDTSLLGDMFLVRSVPELEPNYKNLPPCVHLVGHCIWEPQSTDVELDRWLIDTSGLPLIYVQHGRFFELPSFWPQLLESIKILPCRIAASVGRLDSDVGPIPHNVFARAHVPQTKILQMADAAIASANSTVVLGALSAGVPSLLIPGGGEQPDVAEICKDAGMAKILRPEHVTANKIRECIGEIIANKEYQERGAYFKKAFSKINGAQKSADLLEALVSGSAHGRPDTRTAAEKVLPEKVPED